MKISDRSEIDDTQVNVSFVKRDDVENQKEAICIPYGTMVALDKATTCTFGDNAPPLISVDAPFLKANIRKERELDIIDYSNALHPSN